MLLVGISNEPYQATPKPLMKVFSRCILLPRPEYGTRLCKLLHRRSLSTRDARGATLIEALSLAEPMTANVDQPCIRVRFHLAVLWKTLIPKYGGIITPSLDLTSLAKLSDAYAPGHIHDTIVETLTERRLAKMAKHPLQATDFIPGLSQRNAIYKEEESAFKVRARRLSERR